MVDIVIVRTRHLLSDVHEAAEAFVVEASVESPDPGRSSELFQLLNQRGNKLTLANLLGLKRLIYRQPKASLEEHFLSQRSAVAGHQADRFHPPNLAFHW